MRARVRSVVGDMMTGADLVRVSGKPEHVSGIERVREDLALVRVHTKPAPRHERPRKNVVVCTVINTRAVKAQGYLNSIGCSVQKFIGAAAGCANATAELATAATEAIKSANDNNVFMLLIPLWRPRRAG